MKQETFKGQNYYGITKKCMLSIFGRGNYAVAYFNDPEALKVKSSEDVADFKTRKAAMYSIEHFLAC